MGRLPIVTPVWIYAALMLAAGAMVIPPFLAAVSATRRLARPWIETALLLTAVAITGGLAYAAPAYTPDAPQRRAIRAVVEPNATTATYDVASQEPGLDLEVGAPANWSPASGAPAGTMPWPRFSLPFVFRTTASSPGPPPARITAFTLTRVAGGTELSMTVVPSEAGLSVVFLAPAGVQPARSNLPGVERGGRWRATYVAVPLQGITWQASFKAGAESALPSAAAIVVSSRFPGGTGWQSLPSWLPQEHAVWHAEIMWALRAAE
jgi:hypothetical protein